MKEWFLHHIIPSIKKDKQRRRDEGHVVSPKYVVILDGVSTHCLTSSDEIESCITTVQREDKDLILLWLPANMTGDLQPLDVNFNWPLKAKYKEKLFILKMLSDEEAQEPDVNSSVQTSTTKNKCISRNGRVYHIEQKSDMGQKHYRTHGKLQKKPETALQVKARAIEAIIQTYKEISRDHILTSWRISGRNATRDFYNGTDNEEVKAWDGYNGAWTSTDQNVAIQWHDKGNLFFPSMSGGISDIESKIQFIPVPGRRGDKPATKSADDVEMQEADTTECSGDMSEYDSDECPDIDDSDDELAEFLGDCTLGGDEP